MNNELKESIQRALQTKQRGICIISAETLQNILNYIDNSIPKEVIKEKKTKIKQEHQDIICNNTLAMLDRMINSKLTQGKLEILDELLDTNERR